MHKLINPSSIIPSPRYSHGVVSEGALRWLEIAGQVGRGADGAIPEGIEAQAELAWSNVSAVLKDAGMDMSDLVSITVYLVDRADDDGFSEVRTRWLNGARPASTKVFISGLADPKMRCEVQARAARHT